MKKLIVWAVLAFVATANAGVVRFSAKHGAKAVKFAGGKGYKYGVKPAAKAVKYVAKKAY